MVNNFQSGDMIVEAHSSTSFVWSATAVVVSQKAPEQFTLGQRLCSVANNFQSRDIPQQQHPQIVEAHLHLLHLCTNMIFVSLCADHQS